jgi:hypothetical protein
VHIVSGVVMLSLQTEARIAEAPEVIAVETQAHTAVGLEES